MHGRPLAAALAVLITLALPAAASATTFTVTKRQRRGANSLRAAIDQANANGNRRTVVDVILFDNDGLVPFATIARGLNTALTVTETGVHRRPTSPWRSTSRCDAGPPTRGSTPAAGAGGHAASPADGRALGLRLTGSSPARR